MKRTQYSYVLILALKASSGNIYTADIRTFGTMSTYECQRTNMVYTL